MRLRTQLVIIGLLTTAVLVGFCWLVFKIAQAHPPPKCYCACVNGFPVVTYPGDDQ